MATNDVQIPIQSALDIGGNHFNKDGRDRPVPSQYKGLMTVLVGEFCGTFMFLLLSFIGTQAALDNNSPGRADTVLSPSSLLFIACSFGTALAVNVWIFYRVTGGMFNPAVSTTFSPILQLLTLCSGHPWTCPCWCRHTDSRRPGRSDANRCGNRCRSCGRRSATWPSRCSERLG